MGRESSSMGTLNWRILNYNTTQPILWFYETIGCVLLSEKIKGSVLPWASWVKYISARKLVWPSLHKEVVIAHLILWFTVKVVELQHNLLEWSPERHWVQGSNQSDIKQSRFVQDLVQSIFKYLQDCSFHIFSGQPIHYPKGKKKDKPKKQTKPPKAQSNPPKPPKILPW